MINLSGSPNSKNEFEDPGTEMLYGENKKGNTQCPCAVGRFS